MEVKAGYKKTEIGVIPVDWNLITFNKAFYFLTTASYSRAQLSEIGNIYYVHYGDIHTKLEHFLDFEKIELPFIKKEQLRNYNLLKEGDLIMADASEDYEGIGKSVEIKNIDNKKAISGLHTFLLRGKEGVFTNSFKGYIRSNKYVKSQLDKLATGLKVYGVSKENLRTIQIPLPPLPEQKAIAEVLSDTDNLIQALEKRISKKRLIKQGTMQKLLTPKEDWEVKKLGLECDLVTKGTTPTSIGKNFCKNGINFIKVESLKANGKFIQEMFAYIDEETHSILKRSQLKENDLLISIAGALGRTGIVKKDVLPANTNQALSIIRMKEKSIFYLNYVFYYLRTERICKHIEAISVQGAQPNLSLQNIYDLPIYFPKSKTEQTRIATILSDMDAEIKTLKKKLAKYKLLKQGLMQNLLTGKIRLVNTTQIKKENKVKVIPFIQKKEEKSRKSHNWEINEAVLISVLTNKFGSKDFPLGRKRYTKLSYLFHRYIEKKTEGYLKKAAGPYNPFTKYKGPETIAQRNKYIQNEKKGNLSGFVIAENIAEAERYFKNWYEKEALEWLEQFRFEKNDTLELWTTVDMAIQDLATGWKTISVETVKAFINNHEEWKPKLKRSIFSNENIEKAINKLQSLFKEH